MQRAKEAVSNVAASAKSGMEKTKASVGEKAEKMRTRDPVRKEMAEEKRDERCVEAESEKQGAYDQNVAARQAGYSAEGPVGAGVIGSQLHPAAGTGSTERTGVIDPDCERVLEEDVEIRPRAGGAKTGHGSGASY